MDLEKELYTGLRKFVAVIMMVAAFALAFRPLMYWRDHEELTQIQVFKMYWWMLPLSWFIFLIAAESVWPKKDDDDGEE